jgi:cytochrome b
LRIDPVDQTVKVWDRLVRVFHWSLVAGFSVAWITAEEWNDVHEWSGYAVAGLVAIRVVWGLIGTRYARFNQFIRSPVVTLSFLLDMARNRERRYLGHKENLVRAMLSGNKRAPGAADIT